MDALGSCVVGAIIEKHCSARSILLKAYMISSHVEPSHVCKNIKEKMLLYQINIII